MKSSKVSNLLVCFWSVFQNPRLQVLLESAASHFGSHKPLALCLSSASPDLDQESLAVAGIHVP